MSTCPRKSFARRLESQCFVLVVVIALPRLRQGESNPLGCHRHRDAARELDSFVRPFNWPDHAAAIRGYDNQDNHRIKNHRETNIIETRGGSLNFDVAKFKRKEKKKKKRKKTSNNRGVTPPDVPDKAKRE